jgi:hypothetical protein
VGKQRRDVRLDITNPWASRRSHEIVDWVTLGCLGHNKLVVDEEQEKSAGHRMDRYHPRHPMMPGSWILVLVVYITNKKTLRYRLG